MQQFQASAAVAQSVEVNNIFNLDMDTTTEPVLFCLQFKKAFKEVKYRQYVNDNV